MGKVYDALRRAEEQRTERRAAPSAPAVEAAAGIQTPAAARPRKRPGTGWLRGWFGRERAKSAEGAAAINKRRIALLQPESFVADQFRTLRARLDSIAAERPLRTLAVASALAGEGKTTAAVNLAVVTAMSVGRRVLLVDCDLRKPQIHSALGLSPELGLAEVLADEAPLDRAVIKVEGTNLEVLAVRSTPKNPSELLASSRMRTLLQELAQSYDQVILDTPPTLALPDAKTLSELTDGVVMVVRADTTPQQDVHAALDILDRRRVLGVVLNGAEIDAHRYGY